MVTSIKAFSIQRMEGTRLTPANDHLAVEEPLEIRVNGEPLAAIMRTPGHDEFLALGFLLAEGVLSRADIETNRHRLRITGARDELGLEIPNVLDCELPWLGRDGLQKFKRKIFATSSCGVCGRATLEQICRRVTRTEDQFKISFADLQALRLKMHAMQEQFQVTGGLHAAALFTMAGEPIVIHEDVGRHNAVDKVIGAMIASGKFPLADCGLLVSSRLSFEIVQKAVIAGIPLIGAISAATSLAVELAISSGITLVGFLRDKRAVVYSGLERLELQQ